MEAGATASGAIVRPMRPDEFDLRIGYFRGASDEHLTLMGVDRNLLPSHADWRAYYDEEFSKPLAERSVYLLAWELDGRLVGFGSADNIEFGVEACMHLHILEQQHRRSGLGTEFVRLSVEEYFRALELQRLFCQPNAFNVAPNRTLQRAGFRYVLTAEMAPSEINPLQPITRWVIEQPA